MMSDPIADMLTRIRNGYRAQKDVVAVPNSKLKHALATILTENKYLTAVSLDTQNNELQLTLKYINKKPAIVNIKRISKPGLRQYVGSKSIPRVLSGIGTVVLSTPDGLLTGKQAKEKNIGGEVICTIW